MRFLKYRDLPITVYRGDNYDMHVFIYHGSALVCDPPYSAEWPADLMVDSEGQYLLQPGDTFYVGVMDTHKHFECSIIKKVCTSADVDEQGSIVVKFSNTDTEYLLPGRYFIEGKLQRADGTVKTVLSKRSFIILD